MGTITPVVVPDEGYVRVEVSWADFPSARKCWIYRRVAGVLTMLREGFSAPLSGGIAVCHDHEAPLDTPVAYRSVVALNRNGDMEAGVTEWQDSTNNGTVGVVSQSKDYYVVDEGLASLKLVPSGAAVSKAVSEFVPATAGQSYTITGRLMLPDYWTGGIGVQIQWYNGLTPLTTVGATNDLAPYPGNWGTYGFSATAPATTTQARLVAAIAGTPPAILPMYVDEVYLTTAGTTITSTDVVVPSDGGGWWTDPLRPATKTRLVIDLRASDCLPLSAVVYAGVSEETFPADSDATEVNDSQNPVGTWGVRKSGRQNITVGTLTIADRNQLRALFSTGAPLLLQLPGHYDEGDSYGLYGDLVDARPMRDQRKKWRVLTAPFTKLAAPVGPAEGTWRTRYVDLDRFATFADFAAVGGAWDTFTRVVAAGGLGVANSGQSYTLVGPAADYSVNGAQAAISLPALNVTHRATLAVNASEFDITLFGVTLSAAVTGPTATEQGITARYVDASNFVEMRIFRTAAGMTVNLRQVVAGLETATSFPAVAGVTNTTTVSMRFTGIGSALSAYVWASGTPSAQVANITQVTTHLAAGGAGIYALAQTGITNVLPLTSTYEQLQVTNLGTAPTWLDALQGELAV